MHYCYVYPFGEALAGMLMISGALVWISSAVALFIGGVGAYSVFFVSLTENLMMVIMGVWIAIKAFAVQENRALTTTIQPSKFTQANHSKC